MMYDDGFLLVIRIFIFIVVSELLVHDSTFHLT
jgi:hypothetical protein